MLDIDALFNNVTEKQLYDILQAGENEQVEFKETTPSVLEFAKQVSAFANTKGGVIVVGAREKRPQILYSGPNRTIDTVFDQVAQRVRPLPPIQMHRVNYKGVAVPVIVVKKYANEVIVSDAGAFVRVGEGNHAMTADEIQEKLPQAADEVTNKHLAQGLASVSKTLAEVQADLRYAQSFRGQAPSYLIGFVRGIVASVIASFIYSALVPTQ